MVKRTGGDITMNDGRDVWHHEICADQAADLRARGNGRRRPAVHPLYVGSTGKPKGVLHTTGGYIVYASMTHEYVFDYKPGEVYWCTADVGWVTGHSYIVYGPLANGATTLMFEGVPNYPDSSRFWQVCDKHNVAIFYTAPTAIRALMREGDDPVNPPAARASACWGPLASRSIRKPGSGITRSLAMSAARLSIPGGRRKPAAFSLHRCRARRR